MGILYVSLKMRAVHIACEAAILTVILKIESKAQPAGYFIGHKVCYNNFQSHRGKSYKRTLITKRGNVVVFNSGFSYSF
jgi:ribosomal protein L35AE/L33A